MSASNGSAAMPEMTAADVQRILQFVHTVLFFAEDGSDLEKECEAIIGILQKCQGEKPTPAPTAQLGAAR